LQSQEPKSSALLPSTKQQVSKPPSPRVEQQSQAKEKSSHAQDGPAAPIEAIGQPTADTEKKSAANKPKQSFGDGFTPQTWANWAQVFVAFIGLYVIWRTLRAVQIQAGATEDAARSATSASNTAERSLRTSIATGMKQLRAYMGVESAYVRETTGTLPIVVEVNVMNTGSTMAKDVRVWLYGIYGMDERVAATLYATTTGRSVFMPNGSWMYHEVASATRQDCDRMSQGIGSVVLWGKIDYLDVFGEEHCTRFRYITYKREADGWRVKACEEGNDAT
jgi:hypothetical protein